MRSIKYKALVLSFAVLLSVLPSIVLAHQPRIIYYQQGDIFINNPEISQAYYDELRGETRDYFIDFPAQGEPALGWELYINLLVPEVANRHGRYSANIFALKSGKQELVAFVDGSNFDWQEFYEEFGRDYYLKGPEFEKQVPGGKYKIEVFSSPAGAENQGKYVLAVGKKEEYDIKSLLNVYWQLPLLKMDFFKTDVLQFFFTPFGIAGFGAFGALIIFVALVYYFSGVIRKTIEHRRARTILLTSNGMQMKHEIIELLQKPAYDITVAFITTASKPEANQEYLQKDLEIMRDEMGFNVEEIDIEGKKEAEVMKLLELKDIIFVEGGNTFYLLKAMRACNFERIIKKLLKRGKVYIGASAGSIVAGRTIKTAGWKNGDKNIVGLRNLKGLNLVPFDVFVHYQPEHAELIKKKLPWKWQRKKLKIITDEQAILVQGKEIMIIGEGEQITID